MHSHDASKSPEGPRLVYFTQDGPQIYLNVRADEIGYWRWPVDALKAVDLSAQLTGMLPLALRKT